MLHKKVLEYVENVIIKIDAPEEIKDRLGNQLIIYIIEASERRSVEEIIDKLGSPESLAANMSRKLVYLMSDELSGVFRESDKQNAENAIIPAKNSEEHYPKRKHDRDPHRPRGEYTLEESDVNIKLLYIPLIQISSGVEKIHYYLTDDYFHR